MNECINKSMMKKSRRSMWEHKSSNKLESFLRSTEWMNSVCRFLGQSLEECLVKNWATSCSQHHLLPMEKKTSVTHDSH